MSGRLSIDGLLEEAVLAASDIGRPANLLGLGSAQLLEDLTARFPHLNVVDQCDGSALAGVVALIDDQKTAVHWRSWHQRILRKDLAVLFVDVSFVGAQLQSEQENVGGPSLQHRFLPDGRLLFFDVQPQPQTQDAFVLRRVEASPGLGVHASPAAIASKFMNSIGRTAERMNADHRAALLAKTFGITLGSGLNSSQALVTSLTGSRERAVADDVLDFLRSERTSLVEESEGLKRLSNERALELRARELETLEVAEAGFRLADDLLDGVKAAKDSRAWRVAQQMRRWTLRSKGAEDGLAELEINASSARTELANALVRLRSRGQPLGLPLSEPRGPLVESTSDPVFPQSRHFVQLSPIPWRTPLFQRPQHMTVAMARLGVPATYSTQFVADIDADSINTTPYPGVRIAALDEALGADNQGLVYSFYSTDLTASWATLQNLRRNGNTLIYEYIDEISEDISVAAHELRFRHKYLISPASVDLVVTSAHALYDEMVMRFPRERVILVPNGVDQHHYWSTANQVADWSTFRQLAPGAPLGSTVVGYFGAIAPWLDSQLIREVALELPNFHFAFIGPDYDGVSAAILPLDLPNVHWYGAIDYQHLATVARIFSAAWIPFAEGDIARTTSPLKLFEYIALGVVPVAPTWMPECISIDLVQHGVDAPSLASALSEAVTMRTDDAVIEKLRDLTLSNSWEQRASIISQSLEELGHWPKL